MLILQGYNFFIDGKKVDRERVNSGDKEYIGKFKVKKGSHTIKIKWKDPDTKKQYSKSKSVTVKKKYTKVTLFVKKHAKPGYRDHDDYFVNSWYGGRCVKAQTYLSPSEIKNVNGQFGPIYAVYYSWSFAEEISKTTAPGVVYDIIESVEKYIPKALRGKYEEFKKMAKWWLWDKIIWGLPSKGGLISLFSFIFLHCKRGSFVL